MSTCIPFYGVPDLAELLGKPVKATAVSAALLAFLLDDFSFLENFFSNCIAFARFYSGEFCVCNKIDYSIIYF